MQLVKTITFAGKEVPVKQLTVKQVRELLVNGDTATDDEQLLEDLFPHLLPFGAVAVSTGMTAADLLKDEITQTDLDQLVEAVMQQNPSFARLIQRRTQRLDQLGQSINTLTRSGSPA